MFKITTKITTHKKNKQLTTAEILQNFNQIVDNEIQAALLFKNNINNTFADAVTQMLNCKGKVVLVGVGKNAPIAKKMVATLNSTGTVSQFLHAGEALHGDLGLIGKKDVVLILSKSGNTAEIKSSLKFIQQACSCTIAICGNEQSFLAKNVDIFLDTTVDKEAGFENLAPSSSTTVQLICCDALALTVSYMKGFKSEDFGKFHPGGMLGKQLFLTVGDIIEDNQKPFVTSDSSIEEVIQSLTAGKYGITAILDSGEIKGVITDGDLRRMLLSGVDWKKLKAKDISTPNPKTIPHTTLAKDALQVINKYAIGQLIVVNDKNEYVGIVDFHGLTKEGF